MEAMYFPESVTEAKKQFEILPEPIQLNNGENNIHYTNSFRYLGPTISTDLKEYKEIKIWIGKAWSLMSKFRQVFHSRNVDRKVKYSIYISGPLNMLLWGSKTWNLTKTNMKK